jgi:hypothetical protein
VSLDTVTTERPAGLWQATGNFNVVVSPSENPTDNVQALTTKIVDQLTVGDITANL